MAPLTLTLALAVAGGLATGLQASSLPSYAPYLVLAAALAGWLAHARGATQVRLAAIGIGAAALAVLWGADQLHRAVHPPLRALLESRVGGFRIGEVAGPRLEEPVQVEGRLLEDATPTEAGALVRVAVERAWLGACPEPAAGGVSITVGGALAGPSAREWTRGRLVRAPVLLRRPGVYLNRGVPDEERLLALRGTALVGTVKSAALVEVTSHGPWWDEWAARVRAHTRGALARRMPHDPRGAGIATAILIGDRGGLDQVTERRLQEAGTYHVVAISGGNIAILAGLVVWLLSGFGLGDRRTSLAVVVVLGAYFVITGGGASVARATLMATIYFGIRVTDVRTSAGNSLALTVLVLLLIDPLAVLDVGLWLTVGATAAILAGAGLLGTRNAILGLFLASLSAELALTPIAAAIFQRITIAGLVVNFAAIPCMTVVQIGAMVALAADATRLGPIADAAAWATTAGAWGLVESARLVDLAPWLTWRVPPPSNWLVAAYYTALFAWWFLWRSRTIQGATAALNALPMTVPGAAAHAAAGVTLGLWLWIAMAPATLSRVTGDGRLHLNVFDVGQGDGLLVTFPNGRTLMVDAGAKSPTGTFDVGERVLGPVLRARGVGRLDLLTFTHGDPDHIGGAEALTRAFGPAEIWEGVPVANHDPTRLVREAAARARAGWRTLQQGDRLDVGGVEIRVHHPLPPDWERQKVRNDDSIVLELRHGRVSMLLTGDIGREVEHELIPMLDLLPVVVLKVPHHGSGTSSSEEFLATVKPRVALFSAGRGNNYGHPVPYVLERYVRAGAEIRRTDREGEIEVISDGASVTVSSVLGRTSVLR